MKRAEADDDTLEICAHCECEVDVTPAPHKPGCKGIGQPRASSATSSSTAAIVALVGAFGANARTSTARPVGADLEVREPIRTAEIPYDADVLESEASFLRQRADALEQIAGAIRKLAELSR